MRFSDALKADQRPTSLSTMTGYEVQPGGGYAATGCRPDTAVAHAWDAAFVKVLRTILPYSSQPARWLLTLKNA